MKRFISGFLIGLILAAAVAFFIKPRVVIKEVVITKNVDRLVYRDYKKADCCAIALAYDQTPFHQTFKVKEMKPEYTELALRWDLYERNGEQEIRVPVYQEGNWKFYVGGVVVGAGCYGVYKLRSIL